MKTILVETSARHVHVTEADLQTLFGEGYQLTVKKELSQPGEFASNERVTVAGPKREIAGVMILGPARSATQVEISMTDARSIGVAAPVRESGNVEGSAPVTLIGPAGRVELEQGCIVAKRHIHLTPAKADEYGLRNNQVVKVACGANERRIIFDDVVVRIRDTFSPSMHIDTDESNAAGGPVEGVILD